MIILFNCHQNKYNNVQGFDVNKPAKVQQKRKKNICKDIEFFLKIKIVILPRTM